MDSLCLKATGIHGMSSGSAIGGGIADVRTNPSQVSAVGRGAAATASANAISVEKTSTSSSSRFFFGYPLRSLWPGGGRGRSNGMAVEDAVLVDDGQVEGGESEAMAPEGQNGNWVLKILDVRSRWAEQQGKGGGVEDLAKEGSSGCDHGGGDQEEEEEEEEEECDVCRVNEEEEEEEEEERKFGFDRDSFSKLLRRVTLTEAKLYAQMSYLGNLAYNIPHIKPRNLLRYYGLHFVTSSLEKKNKELLTNSEKDQKCAEATEAEEISKGVVEGKEQTNIGYRISASAAYQIAASAASYLHSHTRSILPFKSSKDKAVDLPDGGNRENDDVNIMNSEVASFMATTDSVTAVVAAKEEVKQAVANDLNSSHSSPCEWYICDDDQTGTRFFVIQGSESLASWQANLLFEPIQFEGLDVLVHRGIYEAAKGIYEQMLPEVQAHLKSRGDRATFRFTGHSLGGSLALLVNLMLLIRGEVPLSSLLPVITFGAPSTMCGGDHLLHKLGLPRSHVQAITMHRDIVPRAFSCNYPNHVAELLKAVNGNFRNHPCLNNQKLLYAPMGELLILQPEEKFSPHHDLLPSGNGLYLLNCPPSDAADAERLLRAAQLVFLNSPHPLEILRDRSAYGSEGTIQRDHDMNSYVKSVRGVVRQELNRIRKTKREHRRKVWWPLLIPRGIQAGVIVERPHVTLNNARHDQFNFSGVLQTGRESLKRFSRLVASQHMHLLVVFSFPARYLLLGTFSGIRFFH